MLGKNILVGLCYFNENEEVIQQLQIHGEITSIKDHVLTFMRSDINDLFSIPFDSDSLSQSDPEAIYTLRSTGEKVSGINYLSTFNIYPEKLNAV